MKKKRLALVILLLALPAALIFFVSPYPRQLVFGPRIQGTPLCAWQDDYRRSNSKNYEGSKSLVEKILAWFRRGPTPLDWRSLPATDMESIVLSLLEDPDSSVRQSLCSELGILGSKATFPALLWLFDDPNEAVREAAAFALLSRSFEEESLLPKLREFLVHPHPHRRYLAVKALCDIKPRSRETFAMLVRMLEDSDGGIRTEGAANLARHPKGVATVKDVMPKLKKILLDQSPMCRLHAARAIWNIDKRDGDFLAVLCSEFKHGIPQIQETVIDYLMLLKDGPATVFPELVALATANESRADKRSVVRALGKCGRKAVPVLIALLDHEVDREYALFALADIGPEAREATPVLLGRIKDLGEFGLYALGKIKSKESVAGLIGLLDDPDADWRMKVVTALGEAGPAAKEAVPKLLALLKDPHEKMPAVAAAALGKIGEDLPTVVSVLTGMLQESKGEIRKAAIEAVSYLGPRGKDAVPLLIKLVEDKEDEYRFSALVALGEIGPEARSAIPSLLSVLGKEKSRDSHYAIMALGKIAQEPDRVVPLLVALVQENRNFLRIVAIPALARFGPAAREAVPSLIPLVDDDDVEISFAAAEALAKIDPQRFGKNGEIVQKR